MVTEREDKWLDAMHGLDAARRVGWARAYAAEEDLEGQRILNQGLSYVMTTLRKALFLAVGTNGEAPTKADLIEAIMQTNPEMAWNVWWLHDMLGYEGRELEDTIDSHTDRFVRLDVDRIVLRGFYRWAN